MNREFSPKVKAKMRERADDRCEICRLRPIDCFHHRLRRSAGGKGTLENGLALCDGPGSCHQWIHNNTGEAYESRLPDPRRRGEHRTQVVKPYSREELELLRVLAVGQANLDANPDRYPPRLIPPLGRLVGRSYSYITPEGRAEAIARVKNGETYSAIARSMGFSHSTIRRAVLGIRQRKLKRWRTVLIPVVLFLVLSVATKAFAHVPSHSAGCEGITVSGVKYTAGGTVDLTIGSSHAHHSFPGPTFEFRLGNPDRTKPESWSIDIVSHAAEGNAHYEGSIDACQTTTTVTGSSTPAATSSIPTTTAPSAAPSTSLPPSSTVPSSTTSTSASTVAPSSSSAPALMVSSTLSTSSDSTPTTPQTNTGTATPRILPKHSNGLPQSLPVTGVDVSPELFAGGMLGLVGFALICVGRRRRFGVRR